MVCGKSEKGKIIMMKRKISVSIDMRIWKWLIGLFIGAIALTGCKFIDKLIWKGFIAISFCAATLIVGVLYSLKLLVTRKDGGKSRLGIFIIVLFFLYSIFDAIITFLASIDLWIYILVCVVLLGIIVSVWSYSYCKQKKDLITKVEEFENNGSAIKNEIKEQSLFTLIELWEEYKEGLINKKIRTTRKGVDFIKIKKGPYCKKFYGDIKFLNNNLPYNGEIYYSQNKVWYIED